MHAPSSTPPLRLLIRSVLVRTKLIDLSVGMFVAAIATSMLLYRGGTAWDRQRVGHRFWENFLSDLLLHRALNGSPNLTGARIASGAMLALLIGIVVAFSLAPEVVSSRRRLGRVVAWLGMVAALGLMAIPLFPSDTRPLAHALAVVLGGLPTVLTFAILVGAMLLEPAVGRPLRFTSMLLLILLVLNLSIYARTAFFRGPSLHLLPTAERTATMLLLIWLMWIARLVRTRLIAAYLVAIQRAKSSRGAE